MPAALLLLCLLAISTKVDVLVGPLSDVPNNQPLFGYTSITTAGRRHLIWIQLVILWRHGGIVTSISVHSAAHIVIMLAV